MSDSEPSPRSSPVAAPSGTALAAALRNAAEQIFNAGDLSGLTLKRVRSAAEKQLKLPEGFFREQEWKNRSKEIIEAEAEALFAANEKGNDNLPSPPAKKPKVPEQDKTRPKKPAKANSAKRGTKRRSPDAEPKAKKRQRKNIVSSSDLGKLPTSGSDGEAPKKKILIGKLKKQREKDGGGSNIKRRRPITDEEVEGDEKDAPRKGVYGRSQAKANPRSRNDAKAAKTSSTAEPDEKGTSNSFNEDGGLSVASPTQGGNSQLDGDVGDVSESEMSIVLDEPAPKPKRKKRPSDTTTSETKSSKTKPPATSPKDDGTPEAEIKQLQSRLLKCGIRKVWSRELAPHSTPKSKIAHLKQMLKDIGMEGRFSAEKARRIKEDRELKAELKAVQDWDRRWGESAIEEDEDAGPKPRRRLAKGLKELDFLGSDGEETE
ncbi:hypothetical protein GP486_004496 [Trichoglossum hirsutum]|uniref:Transcriptional regulator n=1 Tax=Trichoglossum hirsutum TaxID=265104 RepID=A0A9P8RP03_9PEZI|nr:hypothetical protein GP486_004496 [Trichoglossum hirsutum]